MTRLENVIDSRWFKTTILVLWLGIMTACVLNMDNITAESIIAFTPKNKFAAAAVLMLLFALKSLSVIVNSGILFAALGLMFELPAALALSYLGAVICATLPYLIGRTLGSHYVVKLEKKYPKLELVKNIRIKNSFLFVIVIRFIGLIPFDVGSLYLGTVGTPYKSYLPGCIIGMSSFLLPMTILGSSLEDPTSPAFIISISFYVFMTVVGSLIIFFNTKKNIRNSKNRT